MIIIARFDKFSLQVIRSSIAKIYVKYIIIFYRFDLKYIYIKYCKQIKSLDTYIF